MFATNTANSLQMLYVHCLRVVIVSNNFLLAANMPFYLPVCNSDLSVTEWHPFTISSAPDEEVLTVHIKVSSRRDGIVS